jgi:hypothetical protein
MQGKLDPALKCVLALYILCPVNGSFARYVLKLRIFFISNHRISEIFTPELFLAIAGGAEVTGLPVLTINFQRISSSCGREIRSLNTLTRNFR